ncbi:MAG: RHS repeat-associated core domain-containing protein [Acidobacteriota bacterium]
MDTSGLQREQNDHEIDVFTLQDNFSNPQEPTEQMTFSLYGVTEYQVQYWNGSSWQTVSGGSVTANNKVWRKFRFSDITTSKIRVYVTNAAEAHSHVTEIEAYQSATNYSYDAAGNVTNDGAHTYSYDAENRVVSVDNGATASYKYDHQNRRVSKAVGSSLTHYVWQGSQVIAEHDATTPLPGYGQPPYQVQSARVDYVYAGGKMVYSRQRTSSTGAWSERYYLSDRLSTRLVLDGLGNVIGRQAHLPFGEDFAESGTQEKHHFTSYERDGESSTDYAVSRQHSGNVGRFMTADPYKPSAYLIDPESWNRYSYVQNDPVNFTDPTGLFMLAPRFPYDVVIITHPDTDTTPTDTTPPDAKGPGGGAAPSTPLRPGETSERIKSFFDRTPCAQALRNIFGPNATNKIVHKAE